MKTFLSLVLLAGISALPAMAQNQPPKHPGVEIHVKTVVGKVEKIDATTGKFTLRIKRSGPIRDPLTGKVSNVAENLLEDIVTSPDCRYGDEADDLNSLAELKKGEQV